MFCFVCLAIVIEEGGDKWAGREPCWREEQREGEGEGAGEVEESRARDTHFHQTSLYKCYVVHI